jgi:hypothetical protein
MNWASNLIILAMGLTAINLVIYFMFGPELFAMALVWIISRLPGHTGVMCVVYYLEPMGPWPGVCEKACRNPTGALGVNLVDACYFLSGQRARGKS